MGSCADTLRTIVSPSISIDMPWQCQLLHCGFVTQLGVLPRWRLPLRLGNEPRVTLLFQGPPPRTLLVNGRSLPIRLEQRPLSSQARPIRRLHLERLFPTPVDSAWPFHCRSPPLRTPHTFRSLSIRCSSSLHALHPSTLRRSAQVFFKPHLCADLLRLMQTFVTPLRVAAARRQDVSWPVHWLRHLAQTLAEPGKLDGGGTIGGDDSESATPSSGFARALA